MKMGNHNYLFYGTWGLLLIAASLLFARLPLHPERQVPAKPNTVGSTKNTGNSSSGEISSNGGENVYRSQKFGFLIHYPQTFDLLEQYPSTWPPTTAPSYTGPYVITLSPKGSRYASFELDVLPKNAWEQVINAIKDKVPPYSSFMDSMELGSRDGKHLDVTNIRSYTYNGQYRTLLYYFKHPSMPYIFTFRFVEPPTDPKDWIVFYSILRSFQFTT